MFNAKEDLLATDLRTGGSTYFGAAFKGAVQLLRERAIPHVFVGSLALNNYINPRFTEDIQVVCDHPATDQLADELRLVAEQTEFSGSFKVWTPAHPARAYALASKVPISLFGITAEFPSALALCWLFLESGITQGEVDAGSLLAGGMVRSDELQLLLAQYGSSAALTIFEKIKRYIEQGRYTNTYSDFMRARMQRLRLKAEDSDGATHETPPA